MHAIMRYSFYVRNGLSTLIVAAALLNLSGLFVTILGPDGALYATIAKNMVLRGDYLQLFGEGREWLDKPHFPFWITALSFRCFGFTTWAYKLPAILFMFGGAVYTYLFAKCLYGRQTALWSVVILLTAEHIVISNNDVRAEPYLTALIIAAVYHFYRTLHTKAFLHLFLGALFTACAIMTKGMFALVPIGGAIAGELVIKKQWKQLFHLRWLLAGLLVFILIVPELYSLYYQFDAHPEKTVFGRKAVSGIRFFFWDSQFGRFFNTGPIRGKGDPSFFLHTTLWAFLPWSLILYAALFRFLRTGIRNPARQEWYCISGALLTFLLFSASRFQLPHYLNIVFPFFAILTAQYLLDIKNKRVIRWIRIVQYGLILLLMLLGITLFFSFRLYSSENMIAAGMDILLVCMFVSTLVGLFRQESMRIVLYRTGCAALAINLFLNLGFYPVLLTYQSGSEAAFWINKNNKSHLPVAQMVYHQYAYALEFYLDQPLLTIDTLRNQYPSTPFLLYIYPPAKEALIRRGWQLQTMKSFDYYPVSRIGLPFLNKNKRESVVSAYEVVMVNR